MFDTLSTDLERRQTLYKVHAEDQTLVRKYLMNACEFGALATIVFRFGHWVYGVRVPVIKQLLMAIYWVLNIWVMAFFGINVQARSNIGKGFVIHNFSCIFIFSQSIGENLTINQGVTIGSIKGTRGAPTIGNNVFVGAGAKLLGPITIGENVVIAANSLVVSDVPANCTVVGVPARIISRDAKSEYLKT